MNALFFDKHEEEESNEFEMLEQQSIEINALSAEEVRALIAALERKEAGSSDLEAQSDGGGVESVGVEEQVPLSKEDQDQAPAGQRRQEDPHRGGGRAPDRPRQGAR